jgi:DNA-binding NarL/FixJ family response regulator
MSGSQTLEELMSLEPSTRIIISSGSSIEGHARKISEKGCCGVLQKPFTYEALSSKIKEVLQPE